MNKIKRILNLVLILSCLEAQATEISQQQINVQKNAQIRCVAKSLNRCIDKLCHSENDNHCISTCKMTITNQCRYAGE